MRDWRKVADDLVRLADDQRGTPEGDTARQKLDEILAKYPEAQAYEPIVDLEVNDIAMSELVKMKRMGISTGGKWEGDNIQDAIANMVADLKGRRRAGLIKEDKKCLNGGCG